MRICECIIYTVRVCVERGFAKVVIGGKMVECHQVVANIEGDLLGHRGLMDLSTKRLLIPSLRAWHKETVPPEYKVSSSYI